MQIPVIAGYFLYAEQLNARMLGGVALVVAGTLLLRLPSSLEDFPLASALVTAPSRITF